MNVSEELVDAIVIMRATFRAESSIRKYCREKLELTAAQTKQALAAADKRLDAVPDLDPRRELATYIVRCHACYESLVKIQDFARAFKVADTLATRLKLFDTPPDADGQNDITHATARPDGPPDPQNPFADLKLFVG